MKRYEVQVIIEDEGTDVQTTFDDAGEAIDFAREEQARLSDKDAFIQVHDLKHSLSLTIIE